MLTCVPLILFSLAIGYFMQRDQNSFFVILLINSLIILVIGVSGSHDLDDIVAVLASSPQCHRHFARRLWRSFAGTPIDGTVEADIASAIGTSGSLREGVRTMLTHPRFYDADVKVGLVATPVEVLVRTCRGFGLDPARWSLEGDSEEEPPLGWSAQLMGQVPGAPPTVAGWPHNEAWLDARHSAGRALVGRDLAERIVSATTPQTTDLHAAARSDVTDALGAGFGVRRWSTTTARAIDQAAALEDHDDALVTATFIAFCSPEVALS